MPTLLAVIPHPDDEAYSMAGTLALAARAGWRCKVLCASSGERGQRHDGGPTGSAALAATREAELAESCRALGAAPPAYLRLPDGGLAGERTALVRAVAASVGRLRPAAVMALGQDGAYGHPDHVAVFTAIEELRNRGALECPVFYAAFSRGLFLPQYQKCIGMMGDPPAPPAAAIGATAVHYEVDIGALAAAKLAAIAAHRSQLPGGDPHALFPPGIVAATLAVERFTDARGVPDSTAAALLRTFAGDQMRR